MTMIVIVFFHSDFDLETAQIQDGADVDVGIARLANARGAVQVSELEFQLGQILGLAA